jgi:hypothetical protein
MIKIIIMEFECKKITVRKEFNGRKWRKHKETHQILFFKREKRGLS